MYYFGGTEGDKMAKEVSCCLTVTLNFTICMGSMGSRDPRRLTNIRVCPWTPGVPEPVYADDAYIFMLSSETLPFPVRSWQVVREQVMGKPFRPSDSSFPNPLRSWQHHRGCSWEHCPQEPHSVALLRLQGSSEKHWPAGRCAHRQAGSLASVPPADPKLGPPSFLLVFLLNTFTECLRCTRDCFKCLAYTSVRETDRHLLLHGV